MSLKHIFIITALAVIGTATGAILLTSDKTAPSQFLKPLQLREHISLFLSPTGNERVQTAAENQPIAQTAIGRQTGYTQAVLAYHGRRIEFDSRCSAFPSEVTFKSGANVMLDNRSSLPKTVTVGSNSYFINGYSYRIVRLSSSNSPQKFLVDCGAGQNVATLIVQK